MNYEMITIAAASAGQLFDIVNSVQSNRDQCLQLLERVHQIVNTLVNICGDAQKHSVVMNPLMETAVDQFIQTLTTLHGILLSLSSVSLFGRILKHLETRSQLTDCDEALRQALDVFNVQSDLITHSMLGSARTAAKTRHEELLRVLKPEPAVFKPPR
ncbi:unnamed protein product [Mycena citricolor]|nr:unnamed protein product [Mycena citricolor]